MVQFIDPPSSNTIKPVKVEIVYEIPIKALQKYFSDKLEVPFDDVRITSYDNLHNGHTTSLGGLKLTVKSIPNEPAFKNSNGLLD